jgi:hypothetical protein
MTSSIPHRLGKEEAQSRLKADLGSAGANFGHLFSIQEEIWNDDHLQFRVSALGLKGPPALSSK